MDVAEDGWRQSPFQDSALCFHSSHYRRPATATAMIAAARFIRRNSDKIGHHISFSWLYSHLTRNVQQSSSSFVLLNIMFDDSTLSQQERAIMEDIARDPDDTEDLDAWMWSFDGEDASRT